MQPRTPDCGCESVGDDLAVHDRARVLAHLETCPACTSELVELTAAADSLADLIPATTPPEGLSDRTMAAIRAEQHDARPSPVRRLAIAASVVVLLAVGGGTGAIIASSTHQSEHATVLSAPLRSPLGTEGTVVLVASDQKGWLIMTLHDVPASGRVTCAITLEDGTQQVVGTFTLAEGYGS